MDLKSRIPISLSLTSSQILSPLFSNSITVLLYLNLILNVNILSHAKNFAIALVFICLWNGATIFMYALPPGLTFKSFCGYIGIYHNKKSNELVLVFNMPPVLPYFSFQSLHLCFHVKLLL